MAGPIDEGMLEALHPTLYQINTRVWITQIARRLGRPATLDDVADADLDHLAQLGLDWVWLLSVWQTGHAGQQVSRSHPEWRREFQDTLADLQTEDIAGSGFAITGYTVAQSLGGNASLARLRQRLRQRGIRLMLDFVPNHTALDHPWVEEHPEYYIRGSEQDLARAPSNYRWVHRHGGDLVLAHGRDPYFPGWPDTLQLDYAHPGTQEAMAVELGRVACQCDGVRCDMAMLILPDIFERTWGRRPEPFWAGAIRRVRHALPEFRFLAEVYWDLEGALHQEGFDYTYDKRLYDRLREGRARAVREHLMAAPEVQARLARFLENHDEPRAAATFPPGMREAAAVITYLTPGLRLFHQGQWEGRLKRISPHLQRAPEEAPDLAVREFYHRLLGVLRIPRVRQGTWRLLECLPAWEGNPSADALIAYGWQGADGGRLLVTVNFAAHASQGYVRLSLPEPVGHSWQLHDLLGGVRYVRDGNDLALRGLYLDVPPWHCHAFMIEPG